uniref:Rab9 effector protein with kelch motifs n=1 Tax=Geotrypetes seraphini TaxID=260995 RepID=A0A6P8SJA5_GEOSA|nr:rab9 effector protein with kelch motifs [Geotrypetes seraphini]XP_033816508.1 rab9 effector protein with kelch motifs [Geotrypetes seraphini]XP_033816509.1 rab9 effector protein with kelch motifs [Geotrypetes seraphini]
MELLQVLEPEENPQKSKWYALVPCGQNPSSRVGHTCSYLAPAKDDGKGKIVIIGGANPSGSFADAHIIDLDTHEWDIPDWEGLLPRYEHASFIPASSPDSIWIFGGANQSGNRNCIQLLNLEKGTWQSPSVTGTPPSPRTFHTSSAAIGDKLYVFGGGDKGADPVEDTQLHVFDSVTLTWSQPETYGRPPAPRHGHIMIAVGTRLFIHGGLAGEKFYNDIFCLDTNDMKWEKLKVKGDVPSGCAAHSAVAYGKHIYIFGGMGTSGALNTMYKYHIEKQFWTQLKYDSPLPAGRLDHSMCIIPWRVHVDLNNQRSVNSRDKNVEGNLDKAMNENGNLNLTNKTELGSREERDVQLCFIFGGMDTNGEIYTDCCITVIDNKLHLL